MAKTDDLSRRKTAPGLLEACERLLKAAEMHRAWEVHSAEDFNEMYPHREGWAHGDVDDNLLRAMDEARAIITRLAGLSDNRQLRARREIAAAATEIERQAARAEAAERERDALRDRLRWIPVEERLPEDNEYVLGAERHGCQCYTVWLYHHVLRELFVRAFSHWMPLPEPPEGGEG